MSTNYIRYMELNELPSYFKRIQQDFSKGDYAPYAVIYQQIQDSRLTGLIFCKEAQDLAYSICMDSHDNGYVLISLFAVFQDFRGCGFGSAFIQSLREMYKSKQAILVEVERPDRAKNHEERSSRRLRVQFYKKMGFYLIKGIDYSIWDMPMHLMALPLVASKDLIDLDIIRRMREIYLSLMGPELIHKMQFHVTKNRNQRTMNVPEKKISKNQNSGPVPLFRRINVYFNRCFTSTSKVIEQLLSNPDKQEFKIYISHVCENDYLQEVADYFEVEPDLSGKEYVDYCLYFCSKHKIDVFVPRYNVTTLVKYKDDFDHIGVKVMFVGGSKVYQILESKIETYAALRNTEIVAIPKYFLVENYLDFEKAYQEIKDNGSSSCMKPISGIGGNGFKKIVETMTEVEEFYQTTSLSISKERLVRVLLNAQNVDPFMVMEYLEGDEFSIDCFANQGELIVAIPRRKLDYYRQTIEHREDLLTIAQKLTQWFRLSNLYNIQVKFHKGNVYLIEINTRLSGGIHKSGLTGVNFLYLAIMLLMGQAVTTPETIRWDFLTRTIETYGITDLEK